MAQDTPRAGTLGALRGARVPQQGQATAGMGQGGSEKFLSVSGPVSAPLPADTQVPGAFSVPEICPHACGLYQKLPSGEKEHKNKSRNGRVCVLLHCNGVQSGIRRWLAAWVLRDSGSPIQPQRPFSSKDTDVSVPPSKMYPPEVLTPGGQAGHRVGCGTGKGCGAENGDTGAHHLAMRMKGRGTTQRGGKGFPGSLLCDLPKHLMLSNHGGQETRLHSHGAKHLCFPYTHCLLTAPSSTNENY